MSSVPKERIVRRTRQRETISRPGFPTVHRLFEAQAARSPSALAVTGAGRCLTYGQLNARANRLAHRLRALGVGPEVMVGLCGGRTPEMLAGLLGVLKAGAAYVPLDPSYPRERLAYMLDDCRAPVLLAERALLD
ncbi:MAG: AMP-binding protein, partial [Isosphaeraceae bacterium]